MEIIGIAGGTCSGKTTLSNQLAEKLVSQNIKVIHMDNYFKNPTPTIIAPITGIEYPEHNHPNSLRLDDMYVDFDSAISSNSDTVIIEGLFALYLPYIRQKLTLKIFVDLPSDERLIRRYKKFHEMRGQTLDEVANRYLDTVRYRHDELVEPSRWQADIIINGNLNHGIGTEIIYKYLMK